MKHAKLVLIYLLCLLTGCKSFLTQAADIDLFPRDSKTVFLTGGAGFIGSNFLKYMFHKYPNYRFIVLDLLTYAGNLDNIDEEIQQSPRFKFIYGSITNQAIVDLAMSQADFVIHFAAESHVTRSIFDDYDFFQTDVMGTRVMMNSLVRHKNVQRYIHISTSEVFGTAETCQMDELHPLNPRTPYAAAKAGADRLVYAYWCTYDIPVVIIRPFNNYGPNQHTEKVIPRFITCALQNKPLTIHGSGNQKRDWVHTRDIARALDKCLHIKDFDTIKNQVINLGSGRAISILEIARLILQSFGLSENKLNFIVDRPGQVESHISSTKKSWELLHWKPEISFEQGIVEVIEWYKTHEAWWRKREYMNQVPIFVKDKIVMH